MMSSWFIFSIVLFGAISMCLNCQICLVDLVCCLWYPARLFLSTVSISCSLSCTNCCQIEKLEAIYSVSSLNPLNP